MANDLEAIVRNLTSRLHAVEVRDAGGVAVATVATLPLASVATRGYLRYVSNGRKTGEGVGAGTGVLAYNDGVAWRRVSDDSTVLS